MHHRLPWNLTEIGCHKLFDTCVWEAMHIYLKNTRTNNRHGNAQKQALLKAVSAESTRRAAQPKNRYVTDKTKAMSGEQDGDEIVFKRSDDKFTFSLQNKAMTVNDAEELERVMRDVICDEDKVVAGHLTQHPQFCELVKNMLITIHTRGSERRGQKIALTRVEVKVTIHPRATLAFRKSPGREVQTATLYSNNDESHGWTVLQFFNEPGGSERWCGRLHCFLTVEGTFNGTWSGSPFTHAIQSTEQKQVVVSWFRRVPRSIVEPDGRARKVNAQLFPDVTAGLIEDMYEYDAQNRKPEAVPTYRRLIGPRFFQWNVFAARQGQRQDRPSHGVWIDVPWLALNPPAADLMAWAGATTITDPVPMPPLADNRVERPV